MNTIKPKIQRKAGRRFRLPAFLYEKTALNAVFQQKFHHPHTLGRVLDAAGRSGSVPERFDKADILLLVAVIWMIGLSAGNLSAVDDVNLLLTDTGCGDGVNAFAAANISLIRV